MDGIHLKIANGWYSLDFGCLSDWMIALTPTVKRKNTFYSVTGKSGACGRVIHSHNSLAPPHANHQPSHIFLWDAIPCPQPDLFQVSQCGSVGHSS